MTEDDLFNMSMSSGLLVINRLPLNVDWLKDLKEISKIVKDWLGLITCVWSRDVEYNLFLLALR